MSGTAAHDLRYHPARRRAGAGIFAAHRRKAAAGAAADGARRRHHRGRISDRLGGRCRGRPHRSPPTLRSGHCRARALPSARTSSAPPGRWRRRRRRRIHVFIATSDLHLERKLRLSREECLRAAMAAVRLARKYTDDVQFSAEDATRSDPAFLWQIIEAVIQSGATTINLPDTVGYSTPDEVARLFPRLSSRGCPSSDQVTFSAHCHDDLGLAVANTLAAIDGGARQVECTVNGIGERAGQRLARGDRDGAQGPRRSPAVRDDVDTREIYPVEPAADRADRRRRAGQQGDRRPQRLRARSRHSPGRDVEGPPDLRDHASRGRRRDRRRRSSSASTPAAMRCSGVASSSATRSIAPLSSGSTRGDRTRRPRENRQRHRPRRHRPARRSRSRRPRTTAPAAADDHAGLHATPAEVGYGHGV